MQQASISAEVGVKDPWSGLLSDHPDARIKEAVVTFFFGGRQMQSFQYVCSRLSQAGFSVKITEDEEELRAEVQRSYNSVSAFASGHSWFRFLVEDSFQFEYLGWESLVYYDEETKSS